MSDSKAKPHYNAARRIRWLAVGIVVATIAYSAGWYWIAGQVETATDTYIATEREFGTAIDCAERDTRGYPFRVEMFCSSLDVMRPAEGVAVKAGAFRSAAQIYEPRRIYSELDAPVTVETATAGTVRLDWSLARGTVTLADPVPERASVSIDDLGVAFAEIENALSAAHAEAHMRTNEGDLDLAWRYEGLAFDDAFSGRSGLPVLAGDADIGIDNGAAFAAEGIQSLRGLSGEIRRFALLVTPEQGVVASGTVSVGDDGLLDAVLEVIVVDPAGFARAVRDAFPEYASQIDMAAAMPTEAGPDGTPEIRLPISIADGRVKLGLIPLGQIPPLQ